MDTTTIKLEFMDGAEMDCFVDGIFDIGDRTYIILEPNDETADIYLYEYKEHPDGTFEILDIVDEEAFREAASELDEIMRGAI